MDVCRPCHDVLTAWHRMAGVPLDDRVRLPVDHLRAVVAGACGVLALAWRRRCDCLADVADTATLTGRAGSRLLDGLADARRSGRWTDNPKAAAPAPGAVLVTEETEAARAGVMAAWVRPLAAWTYGEAHPWVRLVDGVAARPRAFSQAWTAYVADPAGERQAAAVLDSTRAAVRQAAAVLTSAPDARAAGAARTELDAAGRRLLALGQAVADRLPGAVGTAV